MSRISLNQIDIAEPCHVPWDRMTGTDTARFCQHCQKSVHDLSTIPKDQAERLICESGGNLCVRFARADDGQVMTLDYRSAPGKRGWTWRIWTVIALAAGLTAGVVNAAIFGKRVMPPAPPVAQTQPVRPMMMGVMVMPRAQTPDVPDKPCLNTK